MYKPAENIEGPTSKQQQIACGVGTSSPPQKNIPTVSIVGGSEATPNSWPFVVSVDPFIFFFVVLTSRLPSTNKLLLRILMFLIGGDKDIRSEKRHLWRIFDFSDENPTRGTLCQLT